MNNSTRISKLMNEPATNYADGFVGHVFQCPECDTDEAEIIGGQVFDPVMSSDPNGQIDPIKMVSDSFLIGDVPLRTVKTPYVDDEFTTPTFRIWIRCHHHHVFYVDIVSGTLSNGWTPSVLCATSRVRSESVRTDPMNYPEYLKTDHWQSVREEALKRAGGRCQVCNSSRLPLNTHHRTYERKGNELPGDVIVLCRECHAKFHGKLAANGRAR